MRWWAPSVRVLGVLAALLVAGVPAAAKKQPRAPDLEPAFQVTQLGEGVHLFRPADSDTSHTNSLVVEGPSGVLVVNAQPSLQAGRDLVAAIGRLTAAPIRVVVLPHPHADASAGAGAFPETAMLVANDAAKELLKDPEYDFEAELAARGSVPAGGSPKPHPTLYVRGDISLEVPRPVRVIAVGRAHSRGDLVVEVTSAKVISGGSVLFTDRNPFPGDASLAGWVSLLNTFIEGEFETFVPLVGAPLDKNQLRATRDTLAWVRGEIETLFNERVSPDDMPARILASPRAAQFFNVEANPSFLADAVRVGIAEARAQRRKFGLER